MNGVRFGGQHDHRNVPVQTARQTAAYADGVDEPERVSVDVDDDHVDAVFGEDLDAPARESAARTRYSSAVR